jgi:hypothetical protein
MAMPTTKWTHYPEWKRFPLTYISASIGTVVEYNIKVKKEKSIRDKYKSASKWIIMTPSEEKSMKEEIRAIWSHCQQNPMAHYIKTRDIDTQTIPQAQGLHLDDGLQCLTDYFKPKLTNDQLLLINFRSVVPSTVRDGQMSDYRYMLWSHEDNYTYMITLVEP